MHHKAKDNAEDLIAGAGFLYRVLLRAPQGVDLVVRAGFRGMLHYTVKKEPKCCLRLLHYIKSTATSPQAGFGLSGRKRYCYNSFKGV